MLRAALLPLLLLPIAAAALAQTDAGPDKAEPGIAYTTDGALAPPRMLLFSIRSADIIADAAAWKQRGIDGFFIEDAASDWSSNIWATDGAAWSIGESDETFQKVKAAAAACKAVDAELFLKVVFAHTLDWFDDAAWPQIENNFRQFAIFARGSGCTGVAIDIEYIGQQYDFEWEGYSYNGYTRKDLIEAIRARMTGVMAAMYDAFPDMVFITLPEEAFSLGTHIHAAWIEEAARRNAPGGVHYFMESTYRCPNLRYMAGQVWADIDLMEQVLSKRALRYWRARCSIAPGIWPFGLSPQALYDPGMPEAEFRQECAAARTFSRRYAWVYVDHAREQLFGRKLEVYGGNFDIAPYQRILAAKELIATPQYVALARELRGLKNRDYSPDIGLVPMPRFRAPQGSPVTAMLRPGLARDAERVEMNRLARAYYMGEDMNVRSLFKVQTHWMLIGPFPNEKVLSAHDTVYPPERGIDLKASYDGLGGKAQWVEHDSTTPSGSVELAKLFKPSEHACAYALCYVSSPSERRAQLRIGTNDSGKVWLGKELVYNHARDGMAFLDRDIVELTLPKGSTPILIKVCNDFYNWDFIFRITDENGHAIEDLQYSVAPAG